MTQPKKVLLVDDAEILALLRMQREKEGHAVAVTTHQTMAPRLIREEHPDLIVCDIDMGEVGGGDFAGELRADARLHSRS